MAGLVEVHCRGGSLTDHGGSLTDCGCLRDWYCDVKAEVNFFDGLCG